MLERVKKVTAVQRDAAKKAKDKVKKMSQALDDDLDEFLKARTPLSRTDKVFSDKVDKFIGKIGALFYDYADAEVKRAQRIDELADTAKTNAQKRVLKAKAK